MLQTIIVAIAVGLPAAVALVRTRTFTSGPPQKSNIVILLRGQTFREEENGRRYYCKEFSRPCQFNNSISIVEKVIEPLEMLGNKVDVVVTDEPCSLTGEVSQIYGKRVVASENFDAAGQAENFRRALDVLDTKCGGVKGVSMMYDYVLIFRHDERFKLNFDDWKADWSTINFFAHCGKYCVWDIFHLVPGKLYETFNGVIGTDKAVVHVEGRDLVQSCFSVANDPVGHGHACYYPMLAALQEKDQHAKLGVVFPSTLSKVTTSDYLHLTMPHGDLPPPQEW